MKCPNCQKVVKQTPGKREKQFCNSTCRSNYWAKEKRKADLKPASLPKALKKLKKEVIKNVIVPFVAENKKSVKKKPVSVKSEAPKAKLFVEEKKMPKGLTLQEQIDWKIKNNK